jgi:CDP-paratose 2-epimerase
MTFADRSILVTGGAGFIGTNVADRALREGGRVVILDDLSRPGVAANVDRLQAYHPDVQLSVHVADIRDQHAVRQAMSGIDAVIHLAAQVAVTTSVSEPLHDFEVNLRGTLTLLEAIRRMPEPPSLLFTSTNKVYGGLPDVVTELVGQRHRPRDPGIIANGISEQRPLDFCSPYGCSKGGADQYVLDYAKTYGLQASVFRMSCIYGPHQCGNEDQGWVAHFLLQAARSQPITIYGDGRQVRDLLFIDDLCAAMCSAQLEIERLSGRAFNIGGGPGNAISLLELLALAERLGGGRPARKMAEWRPADQRYYVSDVSAFAAACGWRPRVGIEEGLGRLLRELSGAPGLAAARTALNGGAEPVEGPQTM